MTALKQKLLLVLLALVVVNPTLVYAQSSGVSYENTYQGVQGSIEQYLCTPSDPPNGHDLETCINKLYRFGISFGAIALVFFMVMAGYFYMTGGEGSKTKAKGIFQNAIIGMAILLGSYVLLSFINPSLVIIKPIQPPIFTAADLPRCEDVGFEDDCVLPDGTRTGSAGFGAKIACPGNKIVSAKGLGLPTKQADEQICEPFGRKLLALKSISGWYITDTIGSGHRSQCHAAGNPYSGTCADIGLSDKSTANWNKMCKAILALGDVQPVNEADKGASDCGQHHDYGGTGPHLHNNWRSGGGGGSGGSSSSGGSRPNCEPVSGTQGVCGDGGTSHAGLDWSNTDPALQTAFNNLKGRYPGISAKQVFRSPQYGAHMRSVWEAKALLSGWSDAEVKSYGQYCSSLGIQYVTKADVNNFDATDKAWVDQHFRDHFSGLSSPTTCKSDHGSGIAVDILGGANTSAFETAAAGFGLCHSVPKSMSAHGVTMTPDTNHWALKSKIPGGKCYSYI